MTTRIAEIVFERSLDGKKSGQTVSTRKKIVCLLHFQGNFPSNFILKLCKKNFATYLSDPSRYLPTKLFADRTSSPSAQKQRRLFVSLSLFNLNFFLITSIHKKENPKKICAHDNRKIEKIDKRLTSKKEEKFLFTARRVVK